jgi:hypothetical protein
MRAATSQGPAYRPPGRAAHLVNDRLILVTPSPDVLYGAGLVADHARVAASARGRWGRQPTLAAEGKLPPASRRTPASGQSAR